MESIASFIASIPAMVEINDLVEMAKRSDLHRGIHLAIFVDPYLSYIMKGLKTIESRFSVHKVAPFQQVHAGDWILLKQSGGPVIGFCEVAEPMYFRVDPSMLQSIKEKYGDEILAPLEFWKEHEKSRYCTLLKIHDVKPIIRPFAVIKRDQRGWIVLKPGAVAGTLF